MGLPLSPFRATVYPNVTVSKDAARKQNYLFIYLRPDLTTGPSGRATMSVTYGFGQRRSTMTRVVAEPGTCQVRSGADNPCISLAVVNVFGVPFCEKCAREQEAYFAIGEMTQSREPEFVEELKRLRRGRTGRNIEAGRRAEPARR